ncbi:hypothetical protein PIB30_072777 [Stylosanthes scabra]|uniref:Uncharacterized protein n=1 Tax=Stylosanthes scabra TaxID=79078 RepID=A0ABU6QNR0_9FABA|nr:hypothetical protein [Stylosanthes scabra]
MARNGTSPSAKGKAKAYGPPTRASPRLTALSVQPKRRHAKAPPKLKHNPSKGRTFFPPPKNQEDIMISNDPESEPEKVEEAEDIEEDPEEDPVEAPQGAEIEEDHEEDPMEENAAEEGVLIEDNFADYSALVRSDSENNVGNDYRFVGNAAPAASSVGSCTRPPPADN